MLIRIILKTWRRACAIAACPAVMGDFFVLAAGSERTLIGQLADAQIIMIGYDLLTYAKENLR